MATPPTRVATVVPASGNYTTTTSPKVSAALPALLVGDIIVVVGGSEQAGTNATVTPTASAGSITWTLQTSQMAGTTNQSGEKLWTGIVGAAAAAGATISLARINTGTALWWGFSATVWRDHGGVGSPLGGNSGTASSVAQFTTPALAANSAVQVGINDWNATTIASPSWQVVNGSTMTGTVNVTGASHATALGAYRTDVGAAGTKVVGLTAPATLRWVMVGVEILGTSGSTPSTGTASGAWSFSAASSGKRTPKASTSAGWSFSGTGSGKRTPKASASAAATLAGTASGTRTPKATGSGTYAVAGSASGKAGAGKGAGAGSLSWTAAATGKRTPTATGSGSCAYTGTATGNAPAVGQSDGSGSGSWSLAGTATGRRAPKGTGSSAYAYAGNGLGSSPAVDSQTGTGSGAWLITGQATGRRAPRATGAGVLTLVATATGSQPIAPDYVPPELEVGPVAPPRFTAAAARVSTVTATRTGHSVSAGPARPHRYRRQP